jgi:hypothetical protein
MARAGRRTLSRPAALAAHIGNARAAVGEPGRTRAPQAPGSADAERTRSRCRRGADRIRPAERRVAATARNRHAHVQAKSATAQLNHAWRYELGSAAGRREVGTASESDEA